MKKWFALASPAVRGEGADLVPPLARPLPEAASGDTLGGDRRRKE